MHKTLALLFSLSSLTSWGEEVLRPNLKNTPLLSQSLRLSHYQDNERWISPFAHSELGLTSTPRKNPENIFTPSLFVGGSQNAQELIQKIDSKSNADEINQSLRENFGDPFELRLKAMLSYHYAPWALTQSLSYNRGVNLLITNPVFPKIEIFLLEDVTGVSSWRWPTTRLKNLTLLGDLDITASTQLSYGTRKISFQRFEAALLLDNPISQILGATPSFEFLELTQLLALHHQYGGRTIFELNSLPLYQGAGAPSHSYAQSFVGHELPVLHWQALSLELRYALGLNPWQADYYDWQESWQQRLSLMWQQVLEIYAQSAYAHAQSYGLRLRTRSFELHLFSLQRPYDLFNFQRSELRGLSVEFSF